MAENVTNGDSSSPVIFVSFDSEAGQLIFKDNQGNSGHFITTKVYRAKMVLWKIEHGEELIITNIYNKSDSQNIFDGGGPGGQSDGSWKGKVSKDASGTEIYNVDYTIGDKSYSDDPELEVRDDG